MNNAQKFFEFLKRQAPKPDDIYLTKEPFIVEVADAQRLCKGRLFSISERAITVYNENGRHIFYYRSTHTEACYSFETPFEKQIFY